VVDITFGSFVTLKNKGQVKCIAFWDTEPHSARSVVLLHILANVGL